MGQSEDESKFADCPAIRLRQEDLPLPKVEWGAKHSCELCGGKFYDMLRQPPTCPRCGADRDESMRHLGHEEITNRWIEAVSIIADEQQEGGHDDARLLIDAINREWRKRREDEDFFKWPTTDAPTGTGSFAIDPPEKGMLSYLGYHVGKSGKSRHLRRHILLEVFGRELPPVNSLSYVAEWWQPESAHRLKKMAETIAALARNAERRNNESLRSAIENWEEDLDFLYEELYVRRFSFAWPFAEQ